MILEIKYTKDKGTPKERVVFSVTKDGDIGSYFAFISQMIAPETVANQIAYPYWFPDKEVKSGDLVVLYTKIGKDGFKINKSSSTTHFYYRNLNGPIFKEGDITLLVESDAWEIEK